MKPLPRTDNTPFVRTDFSDDAVWRSICEASRRPPAEDQEEFAEWAAENAEIDQSLGELQAYIDIIDDRAYANLAIEKLLDLIPRDTHHAIVLVVDHTTMAQADHPILVVDLHGQRGRSFRALPAEIQGIENNLSIANMDWEDFAGHVDKHGVFRGFAE